MSLFDYLTNLTSRDDLPEFELDTVYVNEDAGQEIIIRSKDPFLVEYSYDDEPKPANRQLYRQKLSEGIIFKPKNKG